MKNGHVWAPLANADAPERSSGESIRDLFGIRSITRPDVAERYPVDRPPLIRHAWNEGPPLNDPANRKTASDAKITISVIKHHGKIVLAPGPFPALVYLGLVVDGRLPMSWIDIPPGHVTFGVFTGSSAGATVAVAPADLKFLRYKLIAPDTVVIDVRIGKAFFTPPTAVITGITMELSVPFTCPYFPALGAPNVFMDAGQSYSNDCVLVPDPGSPTHTPGFIAVLNESTHRVVLLISSIPGYNVNASHLGVVGAFGQVTFEMMHKG